MATFIITSILLTFYLIQFGNGVYLPNGKYAVPNGGNQLSGSAGGDFPSASSTIQNNPRGNPLSGSAGGDFPSASSTIQNNPRGNQLSGSTGGDFPSASSTIQNNPRGNPYYVSWNQQPDYRKGIVSPDAGSSPYPNKYPVNPSGPRPKYPSITVNSVNNAVSTNSNQPSSVQFSDLDNDLDGF